MIEDMGPNLRAALRAHQERRDGAQAVAEPVTTVGALRAVLAEVPGSTAVGPFAVVEYSPSDARLDLHPVPEPEDDEGDEIVASGVRDVRVTGGGDDLVEIEGGTLTEEWYDPEFGDQGGYVLASSGDLLLLRLTDVGWRIEVVRDATGVRVELAPERDGRDRDEVATIPGPVHWITATTGRVQRA